MVEKAVLGVNVESLVSLELNSRVRPYCVALCGPLGVYIESQSTCNRAFAGGP